MFEAFFFGAKFGGVRDEAASGAASGMLHVQHFVVKDIRHDRLRDPGTIHAAVEDDLIGARIVAAELAAPTAAAPADVRTL